jgi:hypothetical protein
MQEFPLINTSIEIGTAANCFYVYFPQAKKNANEMMAEAMAKGMKAAMKEQNKDQMLEDLRNSAPEKMEQIFKENPRFILFQTWEQVLNFLNEMDVPKEPKQRLPFIPGMEPFPGVVSGLEDF